MTDTAPAPRWLLYGASGYTGTLIAEEAVRRGHRPLLAGRSPEKLSPLADRLGLEFVAVALEDMRSLLRAMEGLPLVLHAAGLFAQTSAPMVRACLATGVHYLDIAGELPVFEESFHRDAEARARGVALLSGVGFDVVPTDCLARYVADRLPEARELDLAFVPSGGGVSTGTARTLLEALCQGGRVRRSGHLRPWPLGKGARRVRFSHGQEHTVVPVPWGDLVTAWYTTGIPDITTYMGMAPQVAPLLRVGVPLLRQAASVGLLRRGLERLVESRVRGPGEEARARGRAYVWAQARAPEQRQVEAWLEVAEGYTFTARAAVRCVEEVLARPLRGALTPALAFGADFVLSVEGTRRLDTLP